MARCSSSARRRPQDEQQHAAPEGQGPLLSPVLRRSNGDMDDGGVIQLPTLFSHLMKLGKDEAGAVAKAAALAATAGGKSNVSLPLLLTPAPTEKAVLFARDSGRVRGWMKSALEDRHIDAQVVASATTLALRWLQRRHMYPSLASSPGATNGTTVSNNAHRQRRRQPASSQQQQQRRRQRRRSGGGSEGLPPLELLSMTCLHLASKYHTQDSVLEDFGSCVHRPEVHALGFDISLSMGAVLNASFRANAVSLQTLLCALSGESPVVKACSEWVSLCLVLLLHPYDVDSENETGASPPHGERVFSPSLSAATAPLTPAPGGPAETPGSQAPSSSASATATPFTPAGASTTTAAAVAWSLRNPDDGKSVAPPAPHQQQQQHGKAGDVRGRFSRATVLALASLVLARRLARAGGPCLPPRVQATMGLGDGDALLLVSEGLRLARRAFETELCDDSQQQQQQHPPAAAAAAAAAAEGGLRGRDFLGGEVLLERKVEGPATGSHPSGTTIARPLLEWLTDSDDGRDAPEFAQGLPLSTATVSSSCSPREKSPSPSRGSVAHDRVPSPGRVTASDGATRRGKRARSSAYHDARGGSGVPREEGGPAARKRQRLGSPPGGPSGRDSGSASPRSRAADRSCFAPAEERAGSSTEEYASAADAFPSPPPSTSPPPRTPSQDAMDRDGATPRSPPSFSAGGASFVSRDATLSGGRRPRGWGRVLFSAQSSDKMSEATQSPPRTRGPPAAPSASSPEERNARWEVLADRVLEALDDRHGGVVGGSSSAGADGCCGGLSTPEGEGHGSSSSSGPAAEVAPILPDRCPLPRTLAGDTVKSSPPGSPPFSPITPPAPPTVFHDFGARGAPGEQGEEALTSSRVRSTAGFDGGDCGGGGGGSSDASADRTGGVGAASLAAAAAAAGRRGARAQGLGVVAAGCTTLMSAVALAFRAASSSTAAEAETDAQEDWWW